MTEAVFDFAAINRRLNRKPEAEPEGIPANGGPIVGSGGSGPANVPWYGLQTNPQLLDAVYRTAASAKQSAKNNLMDNLRAEVEQMEREVLRLDEVLTRACPR